MALEALASVAALADKAPVLQASYGASLGQAVGFSQALHAAGAAAPAAPAGTEAIAPAMKGMLRALDGVNGEARAIGAAAKAAEMQGAKLTPGEMIMLTVRCHEFLFHCQLTSNIANRTSDGLQQLFRQQG